jgi:hypothetical protein
VEEDAAMDPAINKGLALKKRDINIAHGLPAHMHGKSLHEG